MRKEWLAPINDGHKFLGLVQYRTHCMPEPYPDELARVRKSELIGNPAAIQFAYSLECLGGNPPNEDLVAPYFLPIEKTEGRDETDVLFYTRYTSNPDSPSLGLLLTDISRSKIKTRFDKSPVLYQIGPEQRMVALAQRVEYFMENQNPEIHNYIGKLESGEIIIPPRPLRKHKAVEEALGIVNGSLPTKTVALEEIGYKKISSDQEVTRDPQENGYMLNRIGKYPRRIIGGGSMPPATGGVDALIAEALGHMVTFIPRNSVFTDANRQIALARHAHTVINNLQIPELWKERAIRNIGVSIGIGDPEKIVNDARRLYHEGGIRLFRIYTIGADPRILETAKALRNDPEIGQNIEIFVGQIPDAKLGMKLVQEARVDALVFGHGGGRQCTSAENGMAVTTVEEIYESVRCPELQHTTLLVEGGVGRNIGSLLGLGVDGVFFNGRLIHGTMESPAGDIFYYDPETKKIVQPYPGSASAETQLIESIDPDIRKKRTNKAGRIHTEGASGFTIWQQKSEGSMAFSVGSLLQDASRMLADRGVRSIAELREVLYDPYVEMLRQVTPEARIKGTAYKNG